MSIDLIKRLGIFVVLVLVQGLVFNHIHLFNCATPLLYILMVLHFRRNHPRWSVMLWSFFSNSSCQETVPTTWSRPCAPSVSVRMFSTRWLSYSFIIWYSLLWRPSISSIGWSGSSASVAVQPSRCCSSWHWRASARDRTLLQDREQ